MKLWAISDLHVTYAFNAEALGKVRERPDDWLILGGDLGETEENLVYVLRMLGKRFARLLWVPGNHELWTVPGRTSELRGEAKYQRLVAICRDFGVDTPEDPWPIWPGDSVAPMVIAPAFVGYDYSFGPVGSTPEDAVQWAKEGGILARDETLFHSDPYPTRSAWCHARVEETERRLAAVPDGHRIILINHWPLRGDLVRLFRVPRYAPWCGTRKTEDWHRRFPLHVVVSGHLHMRATDWRDGVRFEEVALGYPRHWNPAKGIDGYLREILPREPTIPPDGLGGPRWHR